MDHPPSSRFRDRARLAWKRFPSPVRQRSAGATSPRTVRSPYDDLTCVHDPDGTALLIGVRGVLTAEIIEALHAATADADPGTLVHLDLSRSEIPIGPWMSMLEALADSLEGRDVRIRIVGVSPQHPALRANRRRLDETL